jgi:acetyl esterase/lipase
MKKLLILTIVFYMLITAACTTQNQTAVVENSKSTESTTAPTTAATTTVAPTTSTSPTRGGPGGGGSSSLVAVPAFSNVAYANVSSAEKLDVYIPAGDGPFPLIILVHGGAFMMGDKAAGDATTGVDQLLSQGFAVASVNYRLSGEAKAPAQIQDLKAAVRFLRANAKEYKLNPEKFGAWGGSAGGSLVSLLGTSCGVAELEGPELGNAEQSSCVQAVVDWFGPIDFLQMDAQFAGTSCPADHNAANSPESQLVGGPIQENAEAVKMVNAATYITNDDPPFFIQHGTADCNVPPQQSQVFYNALSSVIGTDKVTFVPLEGAGHGGSQFSTAENLSLVIGFFSDHLK